MSQGSSALKIHVFYAGMIYREYAYNRYAPYHTIIGLPDGAYIRFPENIYEKQWYRSDFTPVLPEDIPPELKTLCLLMGIQI